MKGLHAEKSYSETTMMMDCCNGGTQKCPGCSEAHRFAHELSRVEAEAGAQIQSLSYEVARWKKDREVSWKHVAELKEQNRLLRQRNQEVEAQNQQLSVALLSLQEQLSPLMEAAMQLRAKQHLQQRINHQQQQIQQQQMVGGPTLTNNNNNHMIAPHTGGGGGSPLSSPTSTAASNLMNANNVKSYSMGGGNAAAAAAAAALVAPNPVAPVLPRLSPSSIW